MSTTGSPRVKRQRTPGDEELIPGEYTECQTLWFNDGNIVLMAGNIVFRVHQGVISMHSVVLHDMLDVAKPTADGEQYGGLPLVKLHDHADALAEMLGAMYGRGPTQSRSCHIEVVLSMIELGTKYDYNAFRTEGTRRLYQYVSTSLRKIDRHAAASAGIPQQSQSPSVVEGTTLLHSISLINIARRHNLKKFVLVCAFYMCAQMDPTVLLDGITRRDGTQEKLSLEDFKCSLRGAQKLQEAKLTATYSVLSLSQDCRTPRKCSIAHTDILTEITRNKKLMTTSNCLLLGRGIKPLMIRGAQAGDLCQRCFAKVESSLRNVKSIGSSFPTSLV